MKLLTTNEYKKVESYLKNYYKYMNRIIEYDKAIKEINSFFKNSIYRTVLEVFYIYRNDYKNRYPSNSAIFKYLSAKLYIQEPTLYAIKKEIIYKSAMVFYKYSLM